MTTPRHDAGSFRDREGRVFYQDGKVYRALSERAAAAWKKLDGSKFFPRLVAEGKIVATREAEYPQAALEALSPHWVLALEHERIPFISYPYEWPFAMLRDAARLQLDLTIAALAENMTLKDASAYNVQWRGARPVFIDTASFDVWEEGEPWVGYLQFCQLFLYPLLLTAYRDIPFQSWLRGAIDGIVPADMNHVLTLRDRFRPGVFKDVYIQAKLQASFADTRQDVRGDLQRVGFGKELILNNLRRLRKIVDKLEWQRSSSEWAGYVEESSYDDGTTGVKKAFVAEAAGSQRWNLAWDLGANTGTFSRIAAEHSEYVVAFDGDLLAIERLYLSLQKDGPDNILPLVMNLADPSPALGWRHQERKALTERDRPQLVLCLALIHHLVISANVPMPEFVDWLASLGAHLVIEFVTKDDGQVKKLLRNKPDIYHDYEIEPFEEQLSRHFQIVRRERYHAETRILYFCAP
jgi:hypothetical protein